MELKNQMSRTKKAQKSNYKVFSYLRKLHSAYQMLIASTPRINVRNQSGQPFRFRFSVFFVQIKSTALNKSFVMTIKNMEHCF